MSVSYKTCFVFSLYELKTFLRLSETLKGCLNSLRSALCEPSCSTHPAQESELVIHKNRSGNSLSFYTGLAINQKFSTASCQWPLLW